MKNISQSLSPSPPLSRKASASAAIDDEFDIAALMLDDLIVLDDLAAQLSEKGLFLRLEGPCLVPVAELDAEEDAENDDDELDGDGGRSARERAR